MKIDFWHFAKRGSYQIAEEQSKKLSAALEAEGVQVRHIDEESHHIREHLQRLWSAPPDWTLSFEYASQRGYGFKDLDIPHLHILWQEPYPLHKREGDKEFFALPYPSSDHLFMPLAIEKEAICSPREKTGTAFFGSYRADECITENLSQDFSPYITAKILASVEACLEGLSPKEAFQEPFDSPYLLGVNQKAIYFLISYLAKSIAAKRMLSRFEKVALYGSSSFPVYYAPLCTGSWKSWMKPFKGFTYHGPIPSNEVIATMQKYALILDPTPAFLGVSERLLQGIAAGCEVLTYKNPLVEKYFGRGAGVRYFGEEDLVQDVGRGQNILREFFTWDIRAKEILHALT